ncbi:glycosyltransferase [Alkalihalobacillus oceani]|uniref:MGDG synthase family glycosyltransferase n=1 Tax=Halalkalibacter oceani TaxID=1653776 RepID=UPI00203EBDB0|nr:glycosyltransferase [Halalkalibacter oceani]MCM3761918.1 glycosyltransferase [Halalkalibacter oceani]
MSGVPVVFTASIGKGHDQAALALRKELEARGYSRVTVIDTLHWLHPLLHHSIRMSYTWLLRYRPEIWGKLFSENFQSSRWLDSYEKMIRLFTKQVERFITQESPPFIISTHPLATLLLALAKEKQGCDIPLYSVVTDFQLHRAYVHKQVNRYFTIDEQAPRFAIQNGLSPTLFHVSGIPFPTEPPTPLEAALFREKQNVPLDRATVLVAGGGFGISSYETILEELECIDKQLTILCMTGRNEQAARKINSVSTKHEVRIIPYTAHFVSYMAISDVMITKAGGLTLSEALACEIPLVLYEPIPGHEEQNANIVVEWGLALRAFTRRQISEQTALILSNQRVKEKMIQSAKKRKKPYAAREIINTITLGQHHAADVAHAGALSKGSG